MRPKNYKTYTHTHIQIYQIEIYFVENNKKMNIYLLSRTNTVGISFLSFFFFFVIFNRKLTLRIF